MNHLTIILIVCLCILVVIIGYLMMAITDMKKANRLQANELDLYHERNKLLWCYVNQETLKRIMCSKRYCELNDQYTRNKDAILKGKSL